jgi:hypothetical protein
MWSEIPWIRMPKQTSSRLWEKIPSFNSSLVHVFPFYKVGWFYLNVFLLTCCPTEHILRNTPIWDRLLVTVHEIWVISKFSWKGTEVWLICFKQRGCLLQPSTSKGLEWTSFHTKLSIQGLVHCIVVNEWHSDSRWMFNLTISIETTVYKRVVVLEIIYPNLRDWWGLLDYLMGLVQIKWFNSPNVSMVWNNTGLMVEKCWSNATRVRCLILPFKTINVSFISWEFLTWSWEFLS